MYYEEVLGFPGILCAALRPDEEAREKGYVTSKRIFMPRGEASALGPGPSPSRAAEHLHRRQKSASMLIDAGITHVWSLLPMLDVIATADGPRVTVLEEEVRQRIRNREAVPTVLAIARALPPEWVAALHEGPRPTVEGDWVQWLAPVPGGGRELLVGQVERRPQPGRARRRVKLWTRDSANVLHEANESRWYEAEPGPLTRAMCWLDGPTEDPTDGEPDPSRDDGVRYGVMGAPTKHEPRRWRYSGAAGQARLDPRRPAGE